MNRKLILIGVLLLVVGSNDFNAATILASNGEEVTKGASICANDSYFYETDGNGMYEADIVDSNSRQLMATSNSANGEIELSFPANAGDLGVYIYEYDGAEKTLADSFEFSVSDCGYEVVTEDYKAIVPQTTMKKTETGYQFTQPELEDYSLYINELEANDDGVSKKVRFKDGIGEVAITTDLIQLTESYINDEGSVTEHYFEIDLRNDGMVRQISNVKLTVIEPLEYIDIDILIRIVVGFIVLIVLYIVNLTYVKKYRAKKNYKKKYKLYQMKKKEEAKQKREEERLEKERKAKELEQQKLESERRANLGIRK